MKIMNIAHNINHLYGTTGICQCSFKRPAFNPISKRTRSNACFRRPIGQAHRLIAVCNHPISSLISILGTSACPTAIRLAVVSVYILSLYRHAFRPFSHVIIKVLKPAPLNAYLNATPSVIGEGTGVFIKTPVSHFLPRLVSAGTLIVFSGTLTMFGNSFLKQASATKGVASSQVTSVYNYLLAAVALACPKRSSRDSIFSFATAFIFQHHQATKSISNNVNQLHTINAVRSSVQRLLLPARTSNNIHYSVTA